LTATPALHTSMIFGAPIFNYGYREAVLDGYLVDYEPPYLINTERSEQGIHWQRGEIVPRLDTDTHQIELYTTPDALDFEVEEFNRKVTTAYNEVVCAALAEEIDPQSKQKTLIFCVNNDHADLVVDLLKKTFAKKYGDIDSTPHPTRTNRNRPPSRNPIRLRLRRPPRSPPQSRAQAH
jgi:type I restriction enzyme, R subunit